MLLFGMRMLRQSSYPVPLSRIMLRFVFTGLFRLRWFGVCTTCGDSLVVCSSFWRVLDCVRVQTYVYVLRFLDQAQE